jgi:AraC-like DNA-binding protein
MIGIDLNKPILYMHASFRLFEEKEHHISRFCDDNVLIMVYKGILRFSEDGVEREVCAGEYYIQRKNCYQAGPVASDSPQYLYVHFSADWVDAPDALDYCGSFDVESLFELMTRIDAASHRNELYSELQYLFLRLLLLLRKKPEKTLLADELSRFVEKNITSTLSLSDICEAFHYSKNYIIRIFNEELGTSPIQYINEMKLNRAMYLLETTSRPVGEIATECGYADYPYFYKRFVQKNGVSPLKWRKQMHLNPLHRSASFTQRDQI